MKNFYTNFNINACYRFLFSGVCFTSLILLSVGLSAQVATKYNFSSTLGNYVPITGGHTLASHNDPVTGGSSDDDAYFLEPIGFQFYYNGSSFDQFWVNTNGFIKLGNINTPPSSTYYFGPPLSVNTNCISALSNDLMGQGLTRATSELRVETQGFAPNRVCIIQFSDWSAYPGDITTTSERFNFQIQLYENNGNSYISIVYGGNQTNGAGGWTNPANAVQVGISGSTVTDYNARVGSWTASTAALNNTSGMTFSSSIVPDSGRTFTWSIAPEAMVIDSFSTIGVTAGAIQGSADNAVLAAVVYTHGDSARSVITQLDFNTNGTTNVTDLISAKVYYSGTNPLFSPSVSTQFGTTVYAPSGSLTFNGNETLNPGANYFWLTYDLSAVAPSGNLIDGRCTNITYDYINNNTPNITSPAGARSIIVPMNGNYTIDPAGSGPNNFISFDSALASLYINGVSGPVKFMVAPGTYTFNSTLMINGIPEATAANNVTFEGVNKNTTILTGVLGTAPLVTLNSKYITLRNLTITNTASGSCSGVVILGSTTLNTGTGCKINNCIISLPNIGGSTGVGVGMTIDPTGNSYSSSVLMDSVEIDSNAITGGYYGIAIFGALNISFNKGIKVRNNVFKEMGYYGMYFQYVMNTTEILNNEVTNRGSGYGIYLNRCEGANSSHLISGNKVWNFSVYGIYHNSTTSSLPMVSRIYNNLVVGPVGTSQNCLYVNLLAPSPIEVYNNTLIYNYTTTTTTYGPLFTGGSPNVKVKNNICINNSATGTNPAAYISTSPAGNDINYNVYYNQNASNTNLVSRGGTVYTPATYKTAAAGGDSSFNELPPFAGVEYKLAHACSPRSALDLSAIIPTDFEGDVRSSTPYIGYDETSMALVDIGIDSLVTPKAPITAGLNDVIIRVRNYGTNALYSYNVSYEHNGGFPVTQNLTQNLNTCDTVSAVFTAPNQMNLVGTNAIKVYTSQPNFGSDNNPVNDTLKVNLFGPLSGTYTVGGSTPNFNTIIEAAYALQASGVSGPVTFNVAPGTYTGQVALNGTGIAGFSAATPVVFQGANAATTIIEANLSQQATVLINQCNYITFRNFTINNTNTTNPVGISIVGNATAVNNGTGCAVRSCIVNIPNAGVNASYGISVTASAGGYGNSATWADSVSIDSNIVNGPYYGISFYGRQDSASNHEIKFRNNTVNAFYYGLFINYIYNPIDVMNNTVNMFTPSSSATPYAYYGIYLETNTTRHATTSTRIMNNKVYGSQYYGLYMTTIGAAGSAVVKVYNNFVSSMKVLGYRSIYISSSTGLAEVYHNTFIYNVNTATQSYGAGYFTGAFVTASMFKNNIFICSNELGNSTPAYFATAPTSGNVDYNIYYNASGGNLFFKPSTYYTAANYNTAASGGVNSYNTYPGFVNVESDAHLTVACSPRGTNLNALVPADIDGDTRNNLPQIGADEYVSAGLDALIEAISQPTIPVSAGSQNLAVTIRNNGSTTLTSLTVTYRLNAGSPVSQNWTGSLAPCGTATITFTGAQQINIAGGVSTNLVVYTAAPNGGTDAIPANDTIKATLGTPLSGTYVIGAAPSDYTTINGAVTDMKARGVSGPVIFDIKPGTYNEQVQLPPISTVTAANYVTFKSQTNNRNDVTVAYNSTNQADNYVFRFTGNYMTLKHLSVVAQNNTYGHAIEFAGNASSDSVVFCNVSALQTTTTSNNMAVIYGNPVAGTNNVITNNSILNGAIGVYIYGTSTSVLNTGTVVEGNDIQNFYYAGTYFYYTNNLKLRNNTISSVLYGAGYGLYGYYCDNNLEVVNNSINLSSGGYGMSLYYCDGSALNRPLVANNVITIGGGTAYGIRNYYSSYFKIINNSVNITSSSTGTYAAYLYYSSATYNYNEVYNNMFVNSGPGYAIYAYNGTTAPNCEYDYNFLSTAGAYLGYIGQTGIAYTTLDQWRAAFMHDTHSVSDRAPYVSASNLNINLNDSNAWLVNGNGIQIAGNTLDKAGNPRSTTLIGGAPDIGAYEITPVAAPAVAVAVPATPAPGTVQAFFNGVDTIAKITWDAFAPTPASVTARLYSGAYPNVSPTGVHSLNSYWDFDVPPGGYNYSITLYYRESWLGSIPYESNMIGAKRSGANPWSTYASPQSVVDSIANTLTINTLYDFSMFTGTTIVNPVPVKLTVFKATPVGKDVLVYWNTASERNSAYFNVEASVDGRTYTVVGRVNAKGNSSESNSYSFNHSSAQAAMGGATMIYYRLTSVDRDGSKEQSKVVLVNFNQRHNQLDETVAYPNPFNRQVTLTVPAVGDDRLLVQVSDMHGRVLSTFTEALVQGINEVALSNLESLKAGVYFIKASTGNGDVKVIKVVKE